MVNIQQLSGKDFDIKLEDELLTEEFTLNDLGISARRLQNWSESGLLPDSDRETDENHKFSFVGLIWLKLVIELRGIGIPLQIIKEAKKHLLKKKTLNETIGLTNDKEVAEWLYKIWQDQISVSREKFIKDFTAKGFYKKFQSKKVSQLYWLIMLSLKKREGINIIVFDNGAATGINQNEPPDEEIALYLAKNTHITVPLFKLLLNFIDDKENFDFLSKAKILNDEELKILLLLSTGNFLTMTIHFKNAKPFVMETKEKSKVSKEARLSEILLTKGYQKIEVTTQDGEITYSPITTKRFL
ncbi:MAG: hypothetical protein Q8L81_10295 [Bacteroidota bacterium]|nr:hypothetical protein [Bacteroidota bacterium]